MENPCKGFIISSLVLILAGLNGMPAAALEPTPPIVFIEPDAGAKYLSLVIDSAQVRDVELSVSLFQDGELRAEEKLDYSRFDVQSLEHFPIPEESFHLRRQRENASNGSSQTADPGALSRPALSHRNLRTEGLSELKIDRQTLVDRLRGGVDVAPNRATTAEAVVAFQIPLISDLLRRQKDGFYAASYWVSASLNADPQAKRLENQHWLWFLVQDSQIEVLSLARYSAATDPPLTEKDPLTGQPIMIYLGRSGAEEIPLDKTEKFKAYMVELNTGAEREDSGSIKDRRLEQSEADER